MARLLFNNDNPFEVSPLAYTVERAVGRNGPNDRADVLLVQFILRIATGGNITWPNPKPAPLPTVGRLVAVAPAKYSNLPGPPPGESQIAIDGVCGPQTIRFIEAFQQEMVLRKSMTSPVDGQVVPLGTDTQRTMHCLNLVLLQASKVVSLQVEDLSVNPSFPKELLEEFYV